MNKLSTSLDSNHGCLDFKLENEFQQNIFGVVKTENMKEYLQKLGLETSDKAIYERLVQSVKNSRARGYHGKDDLAQHGDSDLDPVHV